MHIPGRASACMAAACGTLLIVTSAGRAADPPPALKKPVTDVYHGVKVVDDYRWLENYSDPAVRAWSDAQNRYARAYFDRLPARPAILERLKQLYNYPSPGYFALGYRRDTLFALKKQPPKEQPFLVTLHSPDDPGSERIVLDP